jgi:hypothetical protein
MFDLLNLNIIIETEFYDICKLSVQIYLLIVSI